MSSEVSAVDDVELVPDVVEPWLPRLARPAVGVPVVAGALAVGVWGLLANADRGLVTAAIVAVVAAALVVLAVIDMMVLRLPDAIVGPVFAAAGVGALVATAAGELSWAGLGIATACMAGCFMVLWLIAVFTGGSLGYGDVKLAGLLGLVLGLNGPWDAALGGLILPMILGGLVSLPLVLAGQSKREVPFGPYLVLGALLVLLFPDVLTGWWNPAGQA